MAKRYYPFKRVNLTAKTAKLISESLVDKTFQDHYAMVCARCNTVFSGKRATCRHPECESEERLWKRPECGEGTCHHIKGGSLDVARMVEAGMKIGKRRATLDLPFEKGHLLKFVDRLLAFADTWPGRVKEAAERIATEVERYANRTPLEVLAECAIDMDYPEDEVA